MCCPVCQEQTCRSRPFQAVPRLNLRSGIRLRQNPFSRCTASPIHSHGEISGSGRTTRRSATTEDRKETSRGFRASTMAALYIDVFVSAHGGPNSPAATSCWNPCVGQGTQPVSDPIPLLRLPTCDSALGVRSVFRPSPGPASNSNPPRPHHASNVGLHR